MNKIPMRSGCFIPGNLRLNGLILALALGLTTLSSMANMSPSTNGRIHGQAPDVTGTPVILMPDGVTEVTNNAVVLQTARPSDFSLAPLESSLTYLDADGDAALETGFTLPSPEEVTLTWKKDGTLLTAAQLRQRFLDSQFSSGTTLTVSASVTINVTSATGMPDAGLRTVTTPTYQVIVNSPPRIIVGGSVYTDNLSMKTAFKGATFELAMVGGNTANNNRYNFTTNQPGWISVSTNGKVTMTRMPLKEELSTTYIKAVNKTNGLTHYYMPKPELWFMNNGDRRMSYADASSYCMALGGGYKLPLQGQWISDYNIGIPGGWRPGLGVRELTTEYFSLYLNKEAGWLPTANTVVTYENGYWVRDEVRYGRGLVRADSIVYTARVSFTNADNARLVACVKEL